MRSKLTFIIWILIFSLPILAVQLSLLLVELSPLPSWLIYILVLIIGIGIVLMLNDFKKAIFIDLFGTILALFLAFWLSKWMLQRFGNIEDILAINFTISKITMQGLWVYLTSLFGNLIGLALTAL